MNIRWRVGALVAALLLVEVASFQKLSSWLTWTNLPWLAYVSALAFICLLLTAVVALSANIPDGLRRLFVVGGVWLFAVQGLANVLIAYQYGLTALPVEVVTGFFNVNRDVAVKSMAVIQGATLSVVSISFWKAIGQMLYSHWGEQRTRREQLQRLEMLVEEEMKS